MTFDPVCDLRNNVAEILLPGKLCRQTLTEWVLSQSKRKHEGQFKIITLIFSTDFAVSSFSRQMKYHKIF